MADPLEQDAINDLRFVTRMSIFAVVAPQRDILEAIEKYYYPKRDIEKDLGYEPGDEEYLEVIQQKEPDEQDGRDLLDLTGLPPVVRFSNAIIADAIKSNASDIHIEPQKDSVSIRCRVDGIMDETMKTDKNVHAPLVSRIKIISNLDISIALVAVLGQRLLRRICKECKVPDTPSSQVMERIRPYIDGNKEPAFWKGEGCEACQNTGYSGRMALYEVLMMTASLKNLIRPGVSALEIKKAAKARAFKPWL